MLFAIDVPDQVPGFTGMADSMTLQGNTLNLTLSWGEPFNNFDPIISYTVTCSGDVQCPEDHTSPANAMRSYSVTNLNSMTIYNFTIVATNSLGSGEPAVYMTTLISGAVHNMATYVFVLSYVQAQYHAQLHAVKILTVDRVGRVCFLSMYLYTYIRIVPEEVTGLNLTCEPSKTEFYNYCTAEWEVSAECMFMLEVYGMPFLWSWY